MESLIGEKYSQAGLGQIGYDLPESGLIVKFGDSTDCGNRIHAAV